MKTAEVRRRFLEIGSPEGREELERHLARVETMHRAG